MGIFVSKFYFTESKSFARYLPNYMEYNVCSIKIKTKMISLHKIEVEKISSFFEISLQSMVFYFYLLFFTIT